MPRSQLSESFEAAERAGAGHGSGGRPGCVARADDARWGSLPRRAKPSTAAPARAVRPLQKPRRPSREVRAGVASGGAIGTQTVGERLGARGADGVVVELISRSLAISSKAPTACAPRASISLFERSSSVSASCLPE